MPYQNYLPAVTLMIAETRQYELARLALDDCKRYIAFASTVVASSSSSWLDPFEKFVPLPFDGTAPLKVWARHIWENAHHWFTTSHALIIQPDSWVIDPDAWTDEFLAYDYIGAPWWYGDARNVGNGGFRLVSRRFLSEAAMLPFKMPDDEWLCRRYRPALEARGLRFAPDDVASRFAFECVLPPAGKPVFGFHGFQNFPRVLERADLVERLKLCGDYPRDGEKWQAMLATLHSLETGSLEETLA